MDVSVAYCVDDDLSNIVVPTEVKDVYSLLLEEEPYYVLIAKENERSCAKILEGIGLEFYRDFNSVMRASILHPLEDALLLDATFGYTMPLKNTNGQGIRVFGNIDKAEFVVAILGGSTSDPCFYPWKSWGELLWEYHPEKWAIIVGAVVGYTSSEEVVKLLRDILPLNPYLIINFSGTNEALRKKRYVTPYQEKLFQQIKMLRPKDVWCDNEMGDVVCLGVQGVISAAEGWIMNQRTIHAIAEEFGIKHRTYLQPSLYTKQRGLQDEEIFAYSEIKYSAYDILGFNEQVKNIVSERKLDFIVDATNWFDNEDGLVFDLVHTKERGNRLLAQKVYEDIKDILWKEQV